jgi:hypothetical protein
VAHRTLENILLVLTHVHRITHKIQTNNQMEEVYRARYLGRSPEFPCPLCICDSSGTSRLAIQDLQELSLFGFLWETSLGVHWLLVISSALALSPTWSLGCGAESSYSFIIG